MRVNSLPRGTRRLRSSLRCDQSELLIARIRAGAAPVAEIVECSKLTGRSQLSVHVHTNAPTFGREWRSAGLSSSLMANRAGVSREAVR